MSWSTIALSIRSRHGTPLTSDTPDPHLTLLTILFADHPLVAFFAYYYYRIVNKHKICLCLCHRGSSRDHSVF